MIAIVQARTGSTRLPGKVLRPLLGKPMLERMLERVRQAKNIDGLVVATTNLPEDDKVAEIAKRLALGCFRGSEKDVLDRYYHAAKEASADTIVRITGDCPLHDPEVLDLVAERFKRANVDYTITPSNLPEGLDTEIFSFRALETAWEEARLPSEREHVTPYIRNHPERFKIDEKWTKGDFDHSGYHWSVDTENDFKFVERVYQHEYRDTKTFHMRDVLKLLEKHPELAEINKGGTGHEGYQKSLKEDTKWKAQHDS